MKRSAAGGGGEWGQQSGKQKDVTAHVSAADRVGFIYVSEGGGDMSFQPGHPGACMKQEVDMTQRNRMLELAENMNKKTKRHCERYYEIEIPFSINHFTLHFNLHAGKEEYRGMKIGISPRRSCCGKPVLLFCIHKGQRNKKSAEKAVRRLSYQKAIYTSAEVKENRATCNILLRLHFRRRVSLEHSFPDFLLRFAIIKRSHIAASLD